MITQRILSLLEEKSLTATDLCRAIRNKHKHYDQLEEPRD